MLSTRWEQVKEVFEAALLQDERERETFVSSRCGGDTELVQEVHRLLTGDRESTNFLEPAPFPNASLLTAPAGDSLLMEGDVLCGRFKVLGYLGEGGMGQVYRAIDLELRQEIAIKVIRPEIADIPGVLSHFRREVNATRKVTHPNVSRTFDLETHTPSEQERVRFATPITFLTMELLVGETVAERIRRAGALPPDQLRIFAEQVGHALQAAHSAGVIHCDLKPSNIFITGPASDPRFVVTDFGIAKFTNPQDSLSLTTISRMPAATEGTPFYMAPEQIENGESSVASDIYSYGLVLYEVFTGQRLTVYHRSGSGIRTALDKAPAGNSETQHNIDPVWISIITRCTQSDPAGRFANVQEILDLLVRGPTETVEDDRHKPVFIETVSTAGYQLVCAVETEQEPLVNPPNEAPVSTKRPSVTRWWPAAVLLCSLVAALATFSYLHRSSPSLHIVKYSRITNDGGFKTIGGTDGNRVYFTQNSLIEQVGIAGGPASPVPMSLPASPIMWLWDVSPDGSSALVGSSEQGNPTNALWNIRVLGGSTRRLGEADGASFSADGSSVIFSTAEGDIYRSPEDGEPPKKLAEVRPPGYHLKMSPDGKVIRFDRDGQLWEMKSDGSSLHQLLPNWQLSGSQCCGNWTRDGEFYFFLLSGSHSNGVQIWARNERAGLFRGRSGEPFQLTFGPTRWRGELPSRDGNTLFSVAQNPRGELLRFDLQTRQFQRFLGGISAEFVSFSKNGNSIAYVEYPDGTLWKANRDGSKPSQLWNSRANGTGPPDPRQPPPYPVNPRWSPDEKQILFWTRPISSNEHATIYSVPSDGGNPRRLLPDDNEDQRDPNWSPDGQRIVFAGGDSHDPQKEFLRLLDIKTKQISTIPGSVGLFSPRWSSNGRYVLALSSRAPDLMVYDFTINRWSSFAMNSQVQVEFPEFSKDSQFIYFLLLGKDQGVYRIRTRGAKAELVSRMKDWALTGLYGFSMSLDPTDSPLVLRDNHYDDIYALTLAK